MCALYLVGQINIQPVPPYLSKMVKVLFLFYNSFLTIGQLCLLKPRAKDGRPVRAGTDCVGVNSSSQNNFQRAMVYYTLVLVDRVQEKFSRILEKVPLVNRKLSGRRS